MVTLLTAHVAVTTLLAVLLVLVIAAQRLAAEMAATYRTLPYAGAAALSAAVQALPTMSPRARG